MTANTENERMYFLLQKKVEHAAQLQIELNNEKATCARLVDQIQKNEEENEFTAEKINNFEVELDSLQSLLTTAEAKHVAEKNQLNNHIAQLQANLDSMEYLIGDTKKKCGEDCNELRLEISAQNEHIKVLNSTNNSLQARISQIQTVSMPPESANANLQKETQKRPALDKKPQKSKRAKKEQEYEVEKIVGHSMRKEEKVFMIRWKGYGPECDTWESETNLHCPKLLQQYLASIAKANPSQNA